MEWLYSVTPASIINILGNLGITGKKMSVKTELVIEDSPFWINQDLNG